MIVDGYTMDSLWIDFLNSDLHDPLGQALDRDRLRDPAWLRKFTETWKLPRIDGECDPVRSALAELRGALQGLVAVLVRGRPLRPADLAGVNGLLASRPAVPKLRVEGGSVRLRLAAGPGGGLDAVLLAIVESFAAFLAEGDPARLRVCENADCRWVFYYSTRSRTRRWCADSCGNLIKVRTFRRRRKNG